MAMRMPPPTLLTFRRTGRLLALAVLGVLGCSHTEPFGTSPNEADAPFVPGVPARLTYNTDADRSPAWLPDGSAFLYSLRSPESQSEADRCLGWMGAAGGTLTRVVCERSATRDGRTDVFDWPALSPGNRIAYLHTEAPSPGASVSSAGIYVGTADAPLAATAARTLPFTVADRTYSGVWQLGWVDEARLVMIGTRRVAVTPCDTCDPVLVDVGRDALELDLDTGAARTLPGTEHATSVVPLSPNAVLFTLAGDSRIHRLQLADNATTVVYDFGPLGVARDLSVAGSLVTAVVGGQVFVVDDPTHGPVQLDDGGDIYVVDLDTGAAQSLALVDRWFRHPALSPAGDRIVAEGMPGADGGGIDLWLFGR